MKRIGIWLVLGAITVAASGCSTAQKPLPLTSMDSVEERTKLLMLQQREAAKVGAYYDVSN